MHLRRALKSKNGRDLARLIALKERFAWLSYLRLEQRESHREADPGKDRGTKRASLSPYLDVLDTAAWFWYQVEVQLADFDLNLERFRLLELL